MAIYRKPFSARLVCSWMPLALKDFLDPAPTAKGFHMPSTIAFVRYNTPSMRRLPAGEIWRRFEQTVASDPAASRQDF